MKNWNLKCYSNQVNLRQTLKLAYMNFICLRLENLFSWNSCFLQLLFVTSIYDLNNPAKWFNCGMSSWHHSSLVKIMKNSCAMSLFVVFRQLFMKIIYHRGLTHIPTLPITRQVMRFRNSCSSWQYHHYYDDNVNDNPNRNHNKNNDNN